jgi:ankyrin repeat protein
MLYRYTQKSTISQFTTSLSDSELKTYQSDLDIWANLIKEEVNMLVAEKIEDEAQENTRFRALLNKDSKSASLEQKLKIRLRVLDFCSTYDYETPWKQTRKVGNASLFNRTADYHDWKGQVDSCTLLYTGKLGSGKSVLLANIVDDLNLYVHNKDITVAYFFCRYDIPESLDTETIIRSLVRQMLRPIPDLAMVAGFLDDTTSALDFEHMYSLLRHALPSTYKAYFILDGLDECDYNTRNTLILQLRKLQDIFTMLLCISFRLEPDNVLKLNPEDFTTPRTIPIPEDNPDIELYVRNKLENCIESRKLVIGNPTLILEIRDALLQGAQGMFLWVYLQIKSLCAMKTDNAIRQALVDLPRDLSETFARILARSEVVGQLYQRRILELVTVAQRPLQVEELREALSVVPGNPTWNRATLLNNIYSTLACCGSLVIIDEEELTVRLVHHSVKQFLLTGFNTSTSIRFTTAEAHSTMRDIIVTYLNYGVFETQMSTRVVPQIMTGSAPSKIIRSTLDSSGSVRNLALKLLKSKRAPNYDVGQTLAEASWLFNSRPVDEFHFYSYAKSCWQQHIVCASELEPAINNLLLRLLKKRTMDTSVRDKCGQTLLSQVAERGHEAIIKLLLTTGEVHLESKDNNGRTPLLWAIQNRHEAVVKLLLDTGKTDANVKDNSGWTPLWYAVRNRHKTIIKLLLDTGKIDANAKDNSGWTPLWYAVQNRHEAVVELLLDTNKVDANTKTYKGRTPLLWAAQNGHEAIVKLLLNTDKVDANAKDDSGWTPLWYAVRYGHEAVVKLLLNTDKVNANVKIKGGWTPLLWAAQNGRKAVVKLLLDTGKINTNVKDDSGWTPLLWAAHNGHEAVVKLLLNTGKVDANAKDDSGWTPLGYAAQNGHNAVVKLLVNTGKVDANARSDGRTPLSYAAEKGHEAVVKLLLNTGKVDANTKDDSGWTPLWYAVRNGHKAIVKLLLDTGKVDINANDNSGLTLLSWAAQNGHEAVVKLLLSTDKVDANIKAKGGWTPLFYAAEKGHEAVVKLLLNTGKVDANVKTKGGWAPLLWAAQNGHKAVVKLLLDTGKVDANIKTDSGWTPLLWAAHNGHEAVVKLLLDTGKVDTNAIADSRTPILWAAQNGHKVVVKLLLDTGKVDANAKTDGRTPLSYAAESGHEAVVKLLHKYTN